MRGEGPKQLSNRCDCQTLIRTGADGSRCSSSILWMLVYDRSWPPPAIQAGAKALNSGLMPIQFDKAGGRSKEQYSKGEREACDSGRTPPIQPHLEVVAGIAEGDAARNCRVKSKQHANNPGE